MYKKASGFLNGRGHGGVPARPFPSGLHTLRGGREEFERTVNGISPEEDNRFLRGAAKRHAHALVCPRCRVRVYERNANFVTVNGKRRVRCRNCDEQFRPEAA